MMLHWDVNPTNLKHRSMMLHCSVMPASCKGKREADNNGQYQLVPASASKWHQYQPSSGIQWQLQSIQPVAIAIASPNRSNAANQK